MKHTILKISEASETSVGLDYQETGLPKGGGAEKEAGSFTPTPQGIFAFSPLLYSESIWKLGYSFFPFLHTILLRLYNTFSGDKLKQNLRILVPLPAQRVLILPKGSPAPLVAALEHGEGG